MTTTVGGGGPLGVITLSQQSQIFLEMLINKTEAFVCAPNGSCIGGGRCRSAYGQQRGATGTGVVADGSASHLLPPQQVISVTSLLFSTTGGEIFARAPPLDTSISHFGERPISSLSSGKELNEEGGGSIRIRKWRV